MHSLESQIDFLSNYLTDRRKSLIDEVLRRRTDQVTVVLEDVYYAQNISAALRTAECFGLQDIHLVENRHQYDVNPRIVRGATKWLTLHKYSMREYQDPSLACIEELKNSGFKIYATSPSDDAVPISAMDVSGRSAVIFGTELTGITSSVASHTDQLVKIPMKGFTESFNISVSVALILQHVTQEREKLKIQPSLSAERMQSLKFEWYKRTVKHSNQLLKRFNEANS